MATPKTVSCPMCGNPRVPVDPDSGRQVSIARVATQEFPLFWEYKWKCPSCEQDGEVSEFGAVGFRPPLQPDKEVAAIIDSSVLNCQCYGTRWARDDTHKMIPCPECVGNG